MPLDPSVISQGMQAGAAVPNKNTGLSEMIKTITHDLRASKLLKMKTESDTMNQRIEILKSAMSAKYTGDFNKFLQTGDLSSITKQAPFSFPGMSSSSGSEGATGMLSSGGAGGAGGNIRMKGFNVNESGDITANYENKTYTEPEAGIISKSELLVPTIDKLINLVEGDKVYEGLGVPFGASRISAFGEKGPWQSIKRGITAGKGREAGLLLKDIKVLAFGEGGKNLTENEKMTALSMLDPQYKTEEQWVEGLKKAKDMLLRKAELISGVGMGSSLTAPKVVGTGIDEVTGRKVGKLSNGQIIFLDNGEPYGN